MNYLNSFFNMWINPLICGDKDKLKVIKKIDIHTYEAREKLQKR